MAFIMLWLVLLSSSTVLAAPWLTPFQVDVDKYDWNEDGLWPDEGDNSCWLASSANMLSAARYGYPYDIYDTLIGHFGYTEGGSQYEALRWYLRDNLSLPEWESMITENLNPTSGFIASELRLGHFVGIKIWPNTNRTGLGHGLTVWGDDNVSPPTLMWVTDSDRDVDEFSVNSYTCSYDSSHSLYYLNYWSAGYIGYAVTLVPEPATITLLGLGSLVLVRRRRDRERKV